VYGAHYIVRVDKVERVQGHTLCSAWFGLDGYLQFATV
jgi:hypothetical protein